MKFVEIGWNCQFWMDGGNFVWKFRYHRSYVTLMVPMLVADVALWRFWKYKKKKKSLAFFEYEINSVGFNRKRRRRSKINKNKAELVRSNHIGDVYVRVGHNNDKWKISVASDKTRFLRDCSSLYLSKILECMKKEKAMMSHFPIITMTSSISNSH